MALALAVGGGSEVRKSIDETGGSDRGAQARTPRGPGR
jgi:hypothetical protein